MCYYWCMSTSTDIGTALEHGLLLEPRSRAKGAWIRRFPSDKRGRRLQPCFGVWLAVKETRRLYKVLLENGGLYWVLKVDVAPV